MQQNNVLGGAIAVARNGRLFFARGYSLLCGEGVAGTGERLTVKRPYPESLLAVGAQLTARLPPSSPSRWARAYSTSSSREKRRPLSRCNWR
jgi:hypothetical protein